MRRTRTAGPLNVAKVMIALIAGLTLTSCGVGGGQDNGPGNSPGTAVLSISNINFTNLQPNSVTIVWLTNSPSDSLVNYGATSTYGQTASDTNSVTAHSVNITGLTPNTTYNFQVKSRSSDGLEATSSNQTFATPATADTSAPVISGVSATAAATSVTVTWTTNEGADSQVEYGTTTSYGQSTTLDPNRTNSHTVSINGLTAGTTYNYRVKSRDVAGNVATSSNFTVQTTGSGSGTDTTPPVITGVTVTTTATGATINWTTNEPSDTQVDYGTTTAYGQSSTLVSTKVLAHSVALANLTSSTTYNYKVKSRDAAGNLGTSANLTFTTGASSDTTAPVISAIVSTPTAYTASISWTTNEASNTQVDFGTSSSALNSSTGLNSSLTVSHAATVFGLTPSTTYFFRVKSRDAAGNLATSAVGQFSTAVAPPGIPSTLGWFQIPNTKLTNVCPPDTAEYAFRSNCVNVVAAWSGGILDEARNRMIVWGGGHSDYYGNELYSLSLDDLSLTRLNNPSPLNPDRNQCVTTLPDGKPNSRHTYSGLAYIKHANRMYVFGGIVACQPGGGGNDTWTLDLNTLQWTRMDPATGGNPQNISGSIMADYDPNSQKVYLHTTRALWEYDFNTNTYKQLRSGDFWDIHLNGVIDPKRKVFYFVGSLGSPDPSGMLAISIAPGSNYSVQNLTSQVTGCDELMDASSPGLAYDPDLDRIVGWGGGDSVFLFNPDTKSCQKVTYPGGPGAQPSAGTFGRWRYFPAQKVFGVVNNAGTNAWALRLSTLPAPTLASFNPVSGTQGQNLTVGITGTKFLNGATCSFGAGITVNSCAFTSATQLNAAITITTAATVGARTVQVTNPDGQSASLAGFTVQAGTIVPSISNVIANNVSTTSVNVTWNTNVAMTSQIEYGPSTSYGSLTTLDTALATNHSQTLSGLAPDSLYHFRVRSKDVGGAEIISGDLTFSTGLNQVALTVFERAGVVRTSEPVTTGVPFPGGDAASLALFDSNGVEVPVQVTRLKGRTPWFLLDFQTSLAAGSSKTFTLRKQAPTASPANSITAVDSGSQITVNTGVLEAVFRKDLFNGFESVKLNGTTVVTSAGTGNLRLVDHAGTAFTSDSVAPTRVVTEYDGALRKTYRVDGLFNGWSGMRYTVRLTFYAGRSNVKVEYILRNSLQSNERHAHVRQASLRIGTGATSVRGSVEGSVVQAAAVSSSGVTLDLVSSGESSSNNGILVFDWSYRGAEFNLDFSNPTSTEISRQLAAAKTPMMALAPAQWYADYGEMTATKFATLKTEKDTYRAWGWTWSSSSEPSDIAKPDYYLGCGADVHSDLEADDLWQNLLMYLRVEGESQGGSGIGYYHRARAWARYYKWQYAFRTDGFDYKWNGNWEPPNDLISRPNISTGLTTADQTAVNANGDSCRVDALSWGADHLFGWGLADWYLLTGDVEAQEGLSDLAEVAWRMASRRNPGSYGVSSSDPRQMSRWFLVLQRNWEITQDTVVAKPRRDHIASLFRQSTTWNTTYGMDFELRNGSPASPGCTSPTKFISPFQMIFMQTAMVRYYQETGDTIFRDRIVSIGNFFKNYGVNPQTGYTGVYIWVDCTAPGDIRWDNSNSGYTYTLTDLVVHASRIDGDLSRLNVAKNILWNKGIRDEFDPNGNKSCSQVPHFVNDTFLGGTAYYREGEMTNANALFYDGAFKVPPGGWQSNCP